MKQIVRLTESDIHRIVKQAINEALNEGPKTTGKHRKLVNRLKQQYDSNQQLQRVYPNKIKDNGERVQDSMKLHHEVLGMDIINTIGESDAFLYVDFFMDDKLYACFKYKFTDIKDMNEKRIYIRGNVDADGLFRNNELLLTYNIANGTFKRPSGNSVYKFIVNQNTGNPRGAHNASVMKRLLDYKDEYMKP